jgi:hypothetical protein
VKKKRTAKWWIFRSDLGDNRWVVFGYKKFRVDATFDTWQECIEYLKEKDNVRSSS